MNRLIYSQRSFRTIAPLLLVCVLLLVTSSCTVSKDTTELILVNESGDASSAMGQSLIQFADMITAQSNGTLTAKVFHRGELGGQQELYDHLVKGNIDILLSWPGTSYDSRLAILYMPYLVLGWEDAFEAYGDDGWLKNLLSTVFEENGLKFFGPYPEGFGGIATRGKFATNKQDALGIKVRSQPIFPLPQTIQALGFEAVPIDWNEVYTAIQTGVVDGDSSNVIYWDYEYFGDLLDYFVHTRHNFSSFMLMMNNEKYQALSDAQQKLVSEVAQEIIDQQFASAQAEDQKWIKTAQANGMQYIEPSVDEQNSWVELVRDEVWSQSEQDIGKPLMDAIRANASTPQTDSNQAHQDEAEQ